MHCRIRLTWHLDPSWQVWFEDLQIIHEPGETTLLCGTLPDQADLYGVLFTIRRSGCVCTFLKRTRLKRVKGLMAVLLLSKSVLIGANNALNLVQSNINRVRKFSGGQP